MPARAHRRRAGPRGRLRRQHPRRRPASATRARATSCASSGRSRRSSTNADKVKRAAYREGLKAHREDALLSKQLVTLRVDVPVELDLDGAARVRSPTGPPPTPSSRSSSSRSSRASSRPRSTLRRAEHRAGRRASRASRPLVDEARAAGRVALRVSWRARPSRCGRDALGLALVVGARPLGLRAPRPLRPRPAAGPRPRRGARGPPAPLLEDPARAQGSPPTPSATASCSRGSGAARGGARLRRAARRLPARPRPARPTRSRTSRSSSWASAAPVGTDGDRSADARRRSDRRRSPAQEAELVLRLEPAMSARARREEGLLPIYESHGDAARRGAGRHGAGRRQDRRAHLLARDEPRHGGASSRRSRARSTRSPRASSTSTRRSSCARCSSTAWACRAARRRPRRAPPPPPRTCSRSWRSSTSCRARSSTTARCRSSSPPTSTRCPRSSTPRPAASTPPSTRRWPPPAASPRPTPTCRTSRSARPEGRRIREAFVAEPGHLLLSADYSQIELRVLAHLSEDATLIDTFRRGEDVHDRTSREIFGPLSRGAAGRAAAHLQDGQLRAALREDRLHAGQGHRRLAQGGRALHRGLLRALPEGARSSSTTRSRRRARPATCARCSGRLRRLPDLRAKTSRCAWRPSARP